MNHGLADVNPIRGAIYYHFPYVQDENWLKEQALFWDSIYRVIPPNLVGDTQSGYRRRTYTESALVEGLDFVRDFYVYHDAELRDANAGLEALVESSDWFREQSERDEREYFAWIVENVGQPDEVKGYVPPELRHESGYWRYFPGKVYMAILARLLSDRTGMPIVTDDAEHDLVLKATDFAPLKPSPEGVAVEPRPEANHEITLLCSLLFQHVGCSNLSSVPVTKVINFRERHDEERREFVAEVESTVSSLKARTYLSEEELAQFVHESAQKLYRKGRNLALSMRGSGIEATLKASAVSVPLAVGSVESTSLPQLGLSVGAALGTAAIIYGTRRTRRADVAKDAVASYLFLLSKEFDAPAYVDRVRRLAGVLGKR